MFPLARTDDLLAGFYVAGDGRVNPVDVTMALAKGARQPASRSSQGVGDRRAHRDRGAVCGVVTDHGTSSASTWSTAPACGPASWAPRPGVNDPAAGRRALLPHHRAHPRARPVWPVIEDPANYGYYREEVGGLMIGLFEPVCAPWKVGASRRLLVHVASSPTGIAWAVRRGGDVARADRSRPASAPSSAARRASRPTCGRSSARRPRCATTSSPRASTRSASSPAAARALVAHWIVDGDPDADVTGMHIDRLQPYQANPEYRRTRTVESLGMVYQCHYPNARCRPPAAPSCRRCTTASWRRARTSATSAAGRAPTGTPARRQWPRPARSRGAGRLVPHWEAEHRACREGVDRDGHELHVEVPGAGPRRRRGARPAVGQRRQRRAGEITYTQWLNERGTLEADLTVTKLADDSFFVVATDTAHRHVESLAAAGVRGRRACVRHRRHVGLRADQRAGPAVARAAADPHHGRSVERGVPVPRRPGDRPRLRTRAVRAHHLPGRARLRAVRAHRAGGARVRPHRRGRARSGCATRASRRWPACGWRRATATTATTSTTPTACSRPVSASRSRSTSRAGSSGATPCWPAGRGAR
jgi:hypothetical protein